MDALGKSIEIELKKFMQVLIPYIPFWRNKALHIVINKSGAL